MKAKLFIGEIKEYTYNLIGEPVEANKDFQDKFEEWYKKEFEGLPGTKEAERKVQHIKFSTSSSGQGYGQFFGVVLVLYFEIPPET